MIVRRVMSTRMEDPFIYDSQMPLTEANLNRVVNGHDLYGYVIISASRDRLYYSPSRNLVYSKNYIEERENKKIYEDEELIPPGTQRNVDENNKRNTELKRLIRGENYSFVPVYGGYKEVGSNNAKLEKSLIVFPFNIGKKEYTDFNLFFQTMLKFGYDYDQDTILVKAPDSKPIYYDCIVGGTVGEEFSSSKLNDITQEYFTALKKYVDSHEDEKDGFIKKAPNSKPQRFTFSEVYMNKFPQSINEHRIRSRSGELVRFENYPK